MLSYELAKELKDAGFIQSGKGELLGVSGGLIQHNGDVYLPSLSELIEGCPKQFDGDDDSELGNFELSVKYDESGREGYTWWAGYRKDPLKVTILYQGTTPEEAVARLWLALNKPHSPKGIEDNELGGGGANGGDFKFGPPKIFTGPWDFTPNKKQ